MTQRRRGSLLPAGRAATSHLGMWPSGAAWTLGSIRCRLLPLPSTTPAIATTATKTVARAEFITGSHRWGPWLQSRPRKAPQAWKQAVSGDYGDRSSATNQPRSCSRLGACVLHLLSQCEL
ncbi:hypothetical protein NDU88_002123 [Pleurodeles waltl]|uniref:Secreted protein n=1 Tax=Pleurodeles waltl TaxID=8319 RepID=A0AAV7S9D3_PLEWA|nr:hypothetical protein NDU88_002123 [Pleurodeles waltl]